MILPVVSSGMSQKDKKLERMKNNPKGWRIEDLKPIAEEFGLEFRNSKTGSHVTFYYPDHPEILTIPSKRPIKPVYVKEFTALIERIKP